MRRSLRIMGIPVRLLWLILYWLMRNAWMIIRVVFGAIGSVLTNALRWSGRVWRVSTTPMFRSFDHQFDRFAGLYHQALEWALDNRGQVAAVCLTLVVLAAWAGAGLERRLMPQVDQGEFSIEMEMPAGSSLQTTSDATARLEEWLLAMDDVEHVFVNAGLVRSQSAMGNLETDLNTATIRVRLLPDRRRTTAQVVADLRRRGSQILGAELAFNTGETTFTQILGTSQADLAVKVRGTNLDTLTAKSGEIEEMLGAISGLRDIHTDFMAGKPEIRLSVDRRVTEMYGLSVEQVVDLVQATVQGTAATEFQDFDRKVTVLVREAEADRATLEQVLSLGVPIGLSAAGNRARIPLRELVDWRYTTGPNEVRRESQNRQITVFASVEGRALNEAIGEVESLVRDVQLPRGYEIVVGGVNEEMRRSFTSLFFALGLAILLVYMILAAQFESLIHPFTIMFAVPLAVVGVVAALLVFGAGLNVMSLVGTVVLTGIVVNDSIIKVDFINQLREQGRPLRTAIVEAGHYRLRPILMTTVTTVLGLTPMALGLGAGAELRSPLAIAVIGGLISATVLTLIVIPVIYSLLENVRGEHLGDRTTSYQPTGATPRIEAPV
jgi:HAE1 family hydrophobic/amphiphilic exporter-1